MARAASRTRAVLRPRTAKTEGGAGAGGAAEAGGRFRIGRRAKDVTAKEERTAKAGRRFGLGRGAKDESQAKNARAADASARKPRAGRAARSGGQERRPLPFPVRLLAMLFAFAFMVAFAVVLAQLTLEPSPASEALAHTNLHPGRSLRAYLDQPALRGAVKQIGGNLLLGVPFGILVPVLAPRARGVLRVLVLTAVVMLLVEFAQGALVPGRAFDIDDVILNTTGALIGYVVLGRRLSRALHR